MGKSKKDKTIGMWKGLSIALVLMFAVFAGMSLMKPSEDAAALAILGVTVGDDGKIIKCESGTTPDITPIGYDIETLSALTEATNLYKKDGALVWTAFTMGTAITNLDVGGKYVYVAGISTTDMTANAYGPVGSFVVKCQEGEDVEIGMNNDEVTSSLIATQYDRNNNVATATIAANTNQLIYLEWYAGADEVFGNPHIADSGISMSGRDVNYPNMLQLKLNSTDTDKPLSVKIGTVEMSAISCGTIAADTTGFKNYCYEAPVITSTPVKFTVNMDAVEAVAIATDGTAYLHSSNFYVDEDNNNIVQWGNEDEDNNVLGADTADELNIDLV